MKRARPVLGTLVEIDAQGAPEAMLHQAIDAAFHSIQRVHDLMSAHQATSQLGRVNRHAYLRPLRVHPWLYEVLQAAQKLHADTRGDFDCTVAPQLMRSGHLPYRPGCAGLRGGNADIQLLRNFRVRLSKRLCIDLGGIAKGYAVDKAIAVLKRHGVSSAVVNAGGDMRVYGQGAHPIYVRNPAQPGELIALGELHNGAIATSATYFSSRALAENETADAALASPARDVKRSRRSAARSSAGTSASSSALIHPGSRAALVSSKSYSVIASSCLVADALTKAMAFSRRTAPGFLRKYQAQAAILG